MNMTKLYTCLKRKRLKVSEESILGCGIILWGLLSHLLSIAWLVFPTWTCHLYPVPVAVPASTAHSPQPDGTLNSGLDLVGMKGTGWRHGSTWGYSQLCTLPQRLLPVSKYIQRSSCLIRGWW